MEEYSDFEAGIKCISYTFPNHRSCRLVPDCTCFVKRFFSNFFLNFWQVRLKYIIPKTANFYKNKFHINLCYLNFHYVTTDNLFQDCTVTTVLCCIPINKIIEQKKLKFHLKKSVVLYDVNKTLNQITKWKF